MASASAVHVYHVHVPVAIHGARASATCTW